MNRRAVFGACLGFLGALFGIKSAKASSKETLELGYDWPEWMKKPGIWIVSRKGSHGLRIVRVREEAILIEYRKGTDSRPSSIGLVTQISKGGDAEFVSDEEYRRMFRELDRLNCQSAEAYRKLRGLA